MLLNIPFETSQINKPNNIILPQTARVKVMRRIKGSDALAGSSGAKQRLRLKSQTQSGLLAATAQSVLVLLKFYYQTFPQRN